MNHEKQFRLNFSTRFIFFSKLLDYYNLHNFVIFLKIEHLKEHIVLYLENFIRNSKQNLQNMYNYKVQQLPPNCARNNVTIRGDFRVYYYCILGVFVRKFNTKSQNVTIWGVDCTCYFLILFYTFDTLRQYCFTCVIPIRYFMSMTHGDNELVRSEVYFQVQKQISICFTNQNFLLFVLQNYNFLLFVLRTKLLLIELSKLMQLLCSCST